jgi:acetolactate synthase-1/2/3 large subunit
MAKAFHIARSGRPGPVVLDITKDAQFGKFKWEDINFVGPRNRYAKSKLSAEDIKKAAELINLSKRPYLLIGHGVLIAHAEREAMELAEKAGIPVARTLLGLSAFPASHPLCVGMLGMHGHYAPNILTNRADLIIAVGMRFDDRVTGDLSRYAKQAKVIHIEVDPAEAGKIVQPEIALISDAKQALEALLPWVRRVKRDEWLAEFRELERKEREEVIETAVHPQSGGLLMSEVINRLSELTDGEALIVADVGQHQMMAA